MLAAAGRGRDPLEQVWRAVTTTQPVPPTSVVLGTAVVALVLVGSRATWPWVRHLVTIAHEGGHGVAALVTGRQLQGIRLHSDSSGLTVSRGRPRGPGMVLTAFAGYPAPSVLGLLAAVLLGLGHAVALLWVVLLLLALLLLQIRNFFGLWVVLVAAAGVFAVSWWGSGQVQSGAAYLGTWLLLVAGPRPVLEMQAQRRRGTGGTSDADVLARLTPLPGTAWVGVLLAVTLGALALGGWLVLRPVL